MSHKGAIIGLKVPRTKKAPGQSPAGLPERVTKPKAAKPHPIAASLFKGLVRPGGSKVGNPFSLPRGVSQPLPFHTFQQQGQPGNFGLTTGRFGRGKGY
jgi:hypothetical protein